MAIASEFKIGDIVQYTGMTYEASIGWKLGRVAGLDNLAEHNLVDVRIDGDESDYNWLIQPGELKLMSMVTEIQEAPARPSIYELSATFLASFIASNQNEKPDASAERAMLYARSLINTWERHDGKL